jgi:hypothetical protein
MNEADNEDICSGFGLSPPTARVTSKFRGLCFGGCQTGWQALQHQRIVVMYALVLNGCADQHGLRSNSQTTSLCCSRILLAALLVADTKHASWRVRIFFLGKCLREVCMQRYRCSDGMSLKSVALWSALAERGASVLAATDGICTLYLGRSSCARTLLNHNL